MSKILRFYHGLRKTIGTFIVLTLVIQSAVAQQQRNFWTPTSESAIGKNIFTDRSRPQEFQLFKLQEALLKAEMPAVPSEKNVTAKSSTFILTIPNPQGQPEQYSVVQAPVMDPALAAKYPGIMSYAGVGLNNTSTIRFDISPQGFHAIVLSTSRPTFYIDPIDEATSSYIIMSKTQMGGLQEFRCDNKDHLTESIVRQNGMLRNADDANLRTYRLAIAASGEYSQRWLTGTYANDDERRAAVLAALNTNITRVNAIMERDFGARMLIIANNDDIIYLNAGTDPWTSTNSDVLCNQTQNTMTSEIGAANYDVGHLVTEVGDFGNAGCIGCVCSADNTKGRGFTSRSNWNSGNGFEEYILAHEFGHQFGASHTFTHGDDNDASQMEPGSGSSLMSYAGITGANTDIQSIMDDYFHAISIQQVTDYIKSKTCNSGGGSGNSTPTANAGGDYTIPKSTPFTLTGSGSDADGGDVLSFVWEQMDKVTAPGDFPWLPATTHTYGPAFRSVLPGSSTSRTFPVLANILDGTNTNKWEKLPSVGRNLNFRFTVRDNHPGAGNNESDDMVVTVSEEAGPFTVTSPNTATTLCPGMRTVTWDVNGSDALAEFVKISLSTDGGLTFSTLVGSTENDGSATVNITCTKSTQARIKIEGVDNIFFDISNTNFTIGDDTDPTFTKPANVTINKDANCNYDASTSVTGDVTDEDDNCDNTLDATYADAVAPGSCDGETIITRTWTLTDDCGNSTVKVQTITITDVTAPTFTEPADITLYKDATCNHDASVGVTGDVTDEADNCDNTLDATFADVVAPGSCMGEEIITRTWSLSDDCGNSTSHIQIITVRDTTRPSFTNVSPTPAFLWPPNHTMRNVTINYDVADNCSDAAHITSVLTVTSSQPINGTGDGDTSPDWVVLDDHHVLLRAERAGNKGARIYTITITSTDDCGNVGVTTTIVTVAHDQSGRGTNGDITLVPENLFDITEGLVVKASPNPTKGSFAISVNSNMKDKISMEVTDIHGRKIEAKAVMNNSITRIGNNYMPGTYYIRVIQGSDVKVVKVIKL